MIQVPYPTGEHNFVISPFEVDLPVSRNPNNQNNHHMYWTYKNMGRLLITRTFRDLEHNQVELPVDVHTALHQRFSPPKLPRLGDMIEQIETARELGENLKVQEERKGPYFYHQISHIALKQIKMEYDRLNEYKKVA